MKKIQVRDVPDETHAALRRRAAANGKSLQEYLLALLAEHVATPTVAELVSQIEQRAGSRATVGDVVAAVRGERPQQR